MSFLTLQFHTIRASRISNKYACEEEKWKQEKSLPTLWALDICGSLNYWNNCDFAQEMGLIIEATKLLSTL